MSSIKSHKHTASRATLTTATLVTGLSLASMGAASSHGGLDVGDPRVKRVGEVSITGKREHKPDEVQSDKFTQKLQDTPQTIQIISKDLFNQQGATNLSEALRNSPGVGTFYAGENGNSTTGDSVYMRGFDSASSLHVDGVRDIGTVSRDLFNIERIEVFKGPAGTDNGRTPPSGAINLVSKRAHLRSRNSGSLTVGVADQKRATVDINTPLATPGAALRLNGMWQDSGVAGRDHVRNRRWGIAPSLAFGLDTDTRAYLNLLYIKHDNVPDGGVPTIGLPGWKPQPGLENLAGKPVDPANFYGTSSDFDRVTGKMATLRIEHAFSPDMLLSNTARWGQTHQDYLLTAFMGTGRNATTGAWGNIRYTDRGNLDTYTILRSLPTFKDIRNTILTNQTNLNLNFMTGSIRHYLSTGIELTSEKQRSLGRTVTDGSAWTPANLYNPSWDAAGLTWAYNGADSKGRTETASLYAFDTMKINEAFHVTAGIRADRYKTQFNSRVACTATTCNGRPVGTVIPGVNLRDSATLLNWKLGGVYKLSPVTSLYANYAISQQPPGGATFELSGAVNSANNPDFDPQKARTAEVGAKFAMNDARLTLDMALFRTTVMNEINTLDLDAQGRPTQTAEKQVSGFEISTVGNITRAWSVSAGYSHLNTKVTEGPNITADGTNGLTYTPGDSFTSWTAYRFPFGLTLGGGARYNEGLHRGTDGAVGTPAFTKSYTVWDAMASFDFSPAFSLRLNAYNVFDRKYAAAINKSGYRYTPGMPRAFTLTADYRF